MTLITEPYGPCFKSFSSFAMRLSSVCADWALEGAANVRCVTALTRNAKVMAAGKKSRTLRSQVESVF